MLQYALILFRSCPELAKLESPGRTTSCCLPLDHGFVMGFRTCLISSKSSRPTTRRRPIPTGILDRPGFPAPSACTSLPGIFWSACHVLTCQLDKVSESRSLSRSTASSAARVLTRSLAPTSRRPGRCCSKTCKSGSPSASRPTSPSALERMVASALSAPGTAAWSSRSPLPRSALVPPLMAALLPVELAARPRDLARMCSQAPVWLHVTIQ